MTFRAIICAQLFCGRVRGKKPDDDGNNFDDGSQVREIGGRVMRSVTFLRKKVPGNMSSMLSIGSTASIRIRMTTIRGSIRETTSTRLSIVGGSIPANTFSVWRVGSIGASSEVGNRPTVCFGN